MVLPPERDTALPTRPPLYLQALSRPRFCSLGADSFGNEPRHRLLESRVEFPHPDERPHAETPCSGNRCRSPWRDDDRSSSLMIIGSNVALWGIRYVAFDRCCQQTLQHWSPELSLVSTQTIGGTHLRFTTSVCLSHNYSASRITVPMQPYSSPCINVAQRMLCQNVSSRCPREQAELSSKASSGAQGRGRII